MTTDSFIVLLVLGLSQLAINFLLVSFFKITRIRLYRIWSNIICLLVAMLFPGLWLINIIRVMQEIGSPDTVAMAGMFPAFIFWLLIFAELIAIQFWFNKKILIKKISNKNIQ